MKLFQHQTDCLEKLEGLNRVGIYHDMGLGKTFTGAEKMHRLGLSCNVLVCQKSKVQDWAEHFAENYPDYKVADMTDTHKDMKQFVSAILINIKHGTVVPCVVIINYELIFRRPELLDALKGTPYTLMLDESSLICNENAKRSKAILKMQPQNVILLSGTPTAGKYEKLWSQCQLLGWNISKEVFWKSYIVTEWKDYGTGGEHNWQQSVIGYKNVEHLKRKLSEHGAVFLKTDEVMTLPEQIEQQIRLKPTADYLRFIKNSYLEMKDGTELIGDNSLTKILYARQLCGQYHQGKLEAFRDLLDSTEDNFVVFYNFNAELDELLKIASEEGRSAGVVNGNRKDAADGHSILFVQYQAGAYGLNLQGFSNRIIYFTLPLGKGSCDLWEQSKKRIHRIGQKQTCFYYYLLVQNSIEVRNLEALKQGKDFTDELFKRMGK